MPSDLLTYFYYYEENLTITTNGKSVNYSIENSCGRLHREWSAGMLAATAAVFTAKEKMHSKP